MRAGEGSWRGCSLVTVTECRRSCIHCDATTRPDLPGPSPCASHRRRWPKSACVHHGSLKIEITARGYYFSVNFTISIPHSQCDHFHSLQPPCDLDRTRSTSERFRSTMYLPYISNVEAWGGSKASRAIQTTCARKMSGSMATVLIVLALAARKKCKRTSTQHTLKA